LTASLAIAISTVLGVVALVYPGTAARAELPNRIPEAAPYVTAEAEFFPPPFEESWQGVNHPGQCQTCHTRIFDEWNGSMMANAWRDPAWRAAFLLSAATDFDAGQLRCAVAAGWHRKGGPQPVCRRMCDPVRPRRAGHFSMSRPGSLVDGFCSRCHMPTNYVDNVPLQNVSLDQPSGLEHGAVDVRFNPTSDNGTGLAFATLEPQWRNTDSGKSGVGCMICHSLADTRNTPFHNQAMTASRSQASASAPATAPRARLVSHAGRDVLDVPDQAGSNLGYAVGGGAFRLSPHAIGFAERLGPLTSAGRPSEGIPT
jgi:hypothetical protein